jgi:hypothetical protein
MQTPWAILLCKFNDNNSEPYPRQRYEELFTTAGAGKFNMTDYFAEMSHGTLDLSGSKVFGWFTLPKKKSDYVGGPQGRTDLITWAREAAKAHEPDKFFSVVVCMNVKTDLCGGPYGVICDDGRWDNGMSSLSPCMLGQEMGHGHGLNHSRLDGSAADYMDPWDIMSTAGAFMGPHPIFTELDPRARPIFRVGPGINAANMWGQSWLDMTRVWSAGGSEYFGQTIQLRPLHRRDLPGYLAARIGDLFFELRWADRWDSGFTEAKLGPGVVLVHSFFNGNSYIHTDTLGNTGLVVGATFQQGDANDPTHLSPLLSVEVTDINAASQTASLRVTRRHDHRPNVGPGIVIGGIESGGGGWVIVGGKVIKVPPHSPLLHMIEHVAAYHETSEPAQPRVGRTFLQREALQNINAIAKRELERMTSFREPAAPPSSIETNRRKPQTAIKQRSGRRAPGRAAAPNKSRKKG